MLVGYKFIPLNVTFVVFEKNNYAALEARIMRKYSFLNNNSVVNSVAQNLKQIMFLGLCVFDFIQYSSMHV